jgi:hypothetical protein
MIGASRDAGPLRRAPIVEKLRVDAVTAFGRLDVGELNAGIGDLSPVDVALPIGDVDALDGHHMGHGDALVRVLVREHARKRRLSACGKHNDSDGNDRHPAPINCHRAK